MCSPADAQEKAERDRRGGENARDDEGLCGRRMVCPRHCPILSLPVTGTRVTARSHDRVPGVLMEEVRRGGDGAE